MGRCTNEISSVACLFDALTQPIKRLNWTRTIEKDLRWWNEFLPRWNGTILFRRERPCIFVWTDAFEWKSIRGYYSHGLAWREHTRNYAATYLYQAVIGVPLKRQHYQSWMGSFHFALTRVNEGNCIITTFMSREEFGPPTLVGPKPLWENWTI